VVIYGFADKTLLSSKQRLLLAMIKKKPSSSSTRGSATPHAVKVGKISRAQLEDC
jgi:hypothetical protein